MSTNEIAKLESRWRENRQGLTFAPLAEAYRKMKEPQRALEILGEGLGLHPDYIPASIVLGRCHLDLGDDAAAEDAFNRVLALDGENVIALKALAEITERHLRFDEAEGWLRQLLAIDRSNEEARAQLVRVEDSRRNATGIARDESGAAVDTAIITEDRPALVATPPAPVEAAPAEAAPAEVAPAEVAPVEAADEGHDFEPAETVDVEPMAEIESHGETVYTAFDTADAVGAVEGLEPREFVSPDIAVPILEELDESVDVSGSLTPIQKAEELELRSSGAMEFQAPDAAADLGGSAPFSDEEPTLEMPAEQWTPLAADEERTTETWAEPAADVAWPELEEAEPLAEESPDLAPAAAFDEAPTLEEPAVFEDTLDEAFAAESPVEEPAVAALEPDLVVTESMAELYLRQGHLQEALTIYRELFLRNPEDLRLREKVDELETAEAEAESAPARAESWSAVATGGQSVASLFRELLAARPAGAPATPRRESTAASGAESPTAVAPSAGEGEPTRPADDHLSLSAIFGDDSSPVPPAMPSNAPPPSPDGISFDAFFDSAAPAEPAVRRPAAREDDDLDQFHAWLQNLKR
ncbi:MAG: tetratricopeptide repeat protein [Bacillota bacterium]|jgi:tetratricopeptide (TPR) repeat protein